MQKARFYHAALTQHCSKLNLIKVTGIKPDILQRQIRRVSQTGAR